MRLPSTCHCPRAVVAHPSETNLKACVLWWARALLLRMLLRGVPELGKKKINPLGCCVVGVAES